MRQLLLASLLLVASAAQAMLAEAPLPDAVEEARAHALFAALKCVVCEGQSLASSNADFAVSMRNEVRRLIAAGESDAGVREYFVARYGERVLMNPPLSSHTLPLWLFPIFLLLLGAVYLWRSTRHGASS
jgi:cytochrome c-type biogenesis protein CcmH